MLYVCICIYIYINKQSARDTNNNGSNTVAVWQQDCVDWQPICIFDIVNICMRSFTDNNENRKLATSCVCCRRCCRRCWWNWLKFKHKHIERYNRSDSQPASQTVNLIYKIISTIWITARVCVRMCVIVNAEKRWIKMQMHSGRYAQCMINCIHCNFEPNKTHFSHHNMRFVICVDKTAKKKIHHDLWRWTDKNRINFHSISLTYIRLADLFAGVVVFLFCAINTMRFIILTVVEEKQKVNSFDDIVTFNRDQYECVNDDSITGYLVLWR